ncbi:MAG: hypothetical protein FJW30_09735 [Acidobacteria bacterium]|nr:hypothetical protein [Acidobacteriota bacterium]
MKGEMLINDVCHAAGVFLFAHMLYLITRSGGTAEARRLPALCAGIALLWNLLSLVGSTMTENGSVTAHALAATSFSALSLLPAILLQISLPSTFRSTVRTGYVLSAVAVVAHCAELLLAPDLLHRLGLGTITIGFGVLTAQAVLALLWREHAQPRGSTSRLLGTMALFLFATSFVHFGESHTHEVWSKELVIHHAGIPLALFVLLQEWRFLMADAFVRVVANALLALLMAGTVWMLAGRRDAAIQVAAMAGGCAAFAAIRPVAQRAITRVLFGQPTPEEIAPAMRAARERSTCEEEYWQRSLDAVAGLMKARCVGWRPEPAGCESTVSPTLSATLGLRQEVDAEVVIPIRLAAGDVRWGLLGERRGRQPYLSEDLALLARMAAQIAEDVDQIRQMEVKQLVAEAELRALQAQIHPHFLFNALNTLYGVIPKDAAPARRMLLNLSDVFRYFLRAGRSSVTVEEEMQVVRSYLAIEAARLGTKLQMEIDVDRNALQHRIPVLTIQPLVENAVKHGVAANPLGGWLRVAVAQTLEDLEVTVDDSGRGSDSGDVRGAGVGLENVLRRLQISFGPGVRFHRRFHNTGSTAGFQIPLDRLDRSTQVEKDNAAASTHR